MRMVRCSIIPAHFFLSSFLHFFFVALVPLFTPDFLSYLVNVEWIGAKICIYLFMQLIENFVYTHTYV